MRAVFAGYRQVGLCVDRLPCRQKALQSRSRVPVPQERACIAALGAGKEHLDRSLDPDGDSTLFDPVACLPVDKGAPSRRQDVRALLEEAGYYPSLSVTKS